MAEQGRTVMPTGGATGDKGRLTSNKIYNTSYRASYGATATDAGRVNFNAHLGRPSETGFTANQRPAVHYRPSLDHIDNPQFGYFRIIKFQVGHIRAFVENFWEFPSCNYDLDADVEAIYKLLLYDSFMSQTKRHYQPHIRSDSSRPSLVNRPRESGFHQLRNQPKTETVEQKTEYQRLFVPHRLTATAAQNHMTVGPKGETGFTEGTDLQLNTFLDKKCGTVEPRKTHNSLMKSDFVPPSFLQGTEATPSLRSHSSRETGYTRGALAPLACPTSLLPSPQTKINTPTQRIIGKKEPSGSLLNAPNNQAFPNAPFDCSHFTTHYKSTFCHHADFGSSRTSAGIIDSKMDNGYNRRDMDRFIFRG